MKSIKSYINEALISSKNKIHKYKYFPKTADDLDSIISSLYYNRVKENNEIYIDVSEIDVSAITNISDIFYQFTDLTHIKGLKYWDVSNVKIFDAMFAHCGSLIDLSEISNWDVSNGESFRSMFRNCENLKYLDLSKWNLSSCRNDGVVNIFKNSGLEKVNGFEKFLKISKTKAKDEDSAKTAIAFNTKLI